MESKEAFEILGLNGKEDFKTISDIYYGLLKKLLTPNGEHWFRFEDEGKKITAAYFLISNLPEYQKERALMNFWSFIRNYELSDEQFMKAMKDVKIKTCGK